MRFICEWCFSKVPISDKTAPFAEVMSHFEGCEKRSPKLTIAAVSALATHISALVAATDDDVTLRVRNAPLDL
jgi:hypothetical protein